MVRLLKPAVVAGWAALCLSAAQAATLPLGTVVSAQLNGSTETLLGAAAGYAPGPGSHLTPVRDDLGEAEFISDDFALILDFFSSGELRLYVNTDDAALAGERVFDFQFADLPQALNQAAFLDESALRSGSWELSLTGPDSLQLRVRDLQFSEPFSYLSLQLSSATVPEPASLALLGIAALVASRRRRGR